jgi:hypothetical protein
MSFQAYLDTIRQKTGYGPDHFLAEARSKGLLEPAVPVQAVVDWLAADYNLGRGHAMALVQTFKDATSGGHSADDAIAKHFGGTKAHWRPVYESLLASLSEFGDVRVAPAASYISLLHGKNKFAVLAFTADRMDVGVKLKGADVTDRFAASGAWNSMVTHRVQVSDPAELDGELFGWLREAWDAAA